MEEVKERVSTDTRILTEDTYQTLNDMLGSKDPGDHKIAQLILNQVDVEKSIWWIWKLAKNHCNRMVNLRTKDSRRFRDDTSLFGLAYQNEEEFAVWLETKGWLTQEHYQRLKDPIKERIGKNHNNPFYEFHITIKDRYRHLDEEDQILKL